MKALLAALALAAAALAGGAGAAEVCGVSGRNPAEQRALIDRFDDYLARERARRGLGRLAFSRRLAGIAGEYAHVLDQHGIFSHTGPDGRTPGDRVRDDGYCYRFVAENLASGGFDDAAALFQAWMDSPGHRDAMMHDAPTVYGLAANCPPRHRPTGAALPNGSIARLMQKGGALKEASLGDNPAAGRAEIFVMLLALPCRSP